METNTLQNFNVFETSTMTEQLCLFLSMTKQHTSMWIEKYLW